MGRLLSLRHFYQGPLGQATGLHRLGQSKQQMSNPWGLAGQGEPRASPGRVARKQGEARQKHRQVRGDFLLGGQGTTSPQAVRLPHFSVNKLSLQGACLLCRGQVAVLCESGGLSSCLLGCIWKSPHACALHCASEALHPSRGLLSFFMVSQRRASPDHDGWGLVKFRSWEAAASGQPTWTDPCLGWG